MKKNILFLWPPQYMFYGSLFKHITYLGETIDYVRKNIDSNISLMDAGVELFNINEYTKKFKKNEYLIIYIETYTIENSIKIAKFAKQVNKDIKIIGYGTACCYIPKKLLKTDYFDVIIDNGYWEKPICDYINNVDANLSAKYLTKSGSVGTIKKLNEDEWGIPDIDVLPIEKYFEIARKRQLEICVNKGCPYPCSFCSERNLYEKKDTRRSVDSIIEFIERTHNICDCYYFNATTFTYNKEWVEKLCLAICKLDYKIKWRTITRLDSITEDIIKRMSEAGCYKISIGIETLDSNIQKNINKPINIEMMINIFNILKKYNIIPRALLILGLPGQNRKEIMYTYNKLNELGVEIRLKEYCPYNDILNEASTDEEIMSLDRTNYFGDYIKIKDIDVSEYMELLFSGKDS